MRFYFRAAGRGLFSGHDEIWNQSLAVDLGLSGGTGGRGLLECGDQRGGHYVFLDAADAGDRFRRDPQRLALFTRLILGDPEMNDTVADDDVLRPDPRPLLAAEPGEEAGADRAVVALTLARWCALCRPDCAGLTLGP